MKCVLIVDDEVVFREGLARRFESEGYQVFQAVDVLEAQLLIKQNQFDFVLSDLQMPKGTGLDLFKSVQKDLDQGKVLFYLFTGFISLDVEKIIEMGVAGVFTKPLIFEEILEAFSKATEF